MNAWSSSTIMIPHLPEIGTEGFFLQENFERFGGDHQEMRGFAFLPRSLTPGNIPVPFHDREGCRGAECPEPLLLVVDECL